MPNIKFSHRFTKLLTGYVLKSGVKMWGYEAKLLQVIKSDYSNLTAEFIDYDTDQGIYKLPTSGPCIILIFQKVTIVPNLFTTVRSFTPAKMEKYEKLVGQIIDFQIAEK